VSAAVTFRGMDRVKAMLKQYDDRSMTNRLRRGTRAGAAEFRAELRSEGAGSQFPLSFRKTKTNSSTRGGLTGRDIEARVRPASPLFNIFGPGASPHTISPGRGVLSGPQGSAGWDSRGRKRRGRFFSRKPVRHPGMASRPLLSPSFAARLGRAQDAVADALFGPGAGMSPGPDLGSD
jgi:hypothetical protein